MSARGVGPDFLAGKLAGSMYICLVRVEETVCCDSMLCEYEISASNLYNLWNDMRMIEFKPDYG